MNISAANAIASLVPEKALHEDNIIPPLFDKKVADSVAQAVENSAYQEGVARKHPDDFSFYHVA